MKGGRRSAARSLMLTLYLAVSLLIATDVREYARAVAATRLHDPTPRLWGRLTPEPEGVVRPVRLRPAPRADPHPVGGDTPSSLPWSRTRSPPRSTPATSAGYKRDSVIVGLAGPVANLVLAVIALLLLRVSLPAEATRIVDAFAVVNLFQAFFHLLPIPGLDGARLVGLVLPPRAAEVYRNLDAYLALFVLVVIFLLAGPVHGIVFGLTNAVCRTRRPASTASPLSAAPGAGASPRYHPRHRERRPRPDPVRRPPPGAHRVSPDRARPPRALGRQHREHAPPPGRPGLRLLLLRRGLAHAHDALRPHRRARRVDARARPRLARRRDRPREGRDLPPVGPARGGGDGAAVRHDHAARAGSSASRRSRSGCAT